jgi:regulator of sigma E protease
VSWFLAFAGFSVLIILHEAGHMVAAKAVGMRVERFFLFFPPKLVSWRRGETEYGIGMIPLGGFVKITGMNPDEVNPPEDGSEPARQSRLTAAMEGDTAGGTPDVTPLPPDVVKRAYYNQPVWKRIVVIGAGPAVNIFIAFLLFFAISFHDQEADGSGLAVSQIEKGEAADGQLKTGDRIISIDGVTAFNKPISDRASALRDEIGKHTCAGAQTDGCSATTPVQMVVERDGQRVPLTITPRYNADAERPLLGFGFGAADVKSIHRSVSGAVDASLDKMWVVTSGTGTVLAHLFESKERKQISGVVGNYDVTRQAIQSSTRTALLVLAVISLSLGLINLLPFLPLDGGHIFWSLVEKLRGRPVAFSVMERASVVGFALVMVLFLIGLSNDLHRLTSGEGFNLK